MKKLLLSLAAVVGLGFAANADTATYSFSVSDAYGLPTDKSTFVTNETATNGDVALTFSKTSGNGFRIWDDGLRVYNTGKGNATITVKAKDANVTGVKMTVKDLLGSVKINEEAITATNKVYSWTGDAEKAEIVITVSATKAIQTIEVTYLANGDPSLKAAEVAFEEAAYEAVIGNAFESPKATKATTAALAYSSSQPEVATVDAVTGAVTLVAPGTTVITAKAEANNEYNAGEASYTLTVVKAYNTVAEFYTLPKDGTGLVNFDLTVAYVNGANIYATTGDEWTLIFGYNLDYQAGDVIPAGWNGQYAPYAGMPEIKPVGTMPEATETGKTVKFAEATSVDLSMINQVVVLKGVTFAAATLDNKNNNFTGKIGETEISFRNNFSVASVDAGTYDVTCAVGYYEKDATEATDATKLQVYPISYAKTTVGIDEIGVDANAPVEYYNLQGVRVANPENGIFIRRQGNKVSKVVL